MPHHVEIKFGSGEVGPVEVRLKIIDRIAAALKEASNPPSG
jgi:hypothetical protein